MEWTYLYYVAVICISYVGFTSFFLALRQIVGSAIDGAASWSTRYLIAVALCTATTALLPRLLSLFPLEPPVAIRLSSLVAFILLGRLDVIYLWRRSSVFPQRMDLRLSLLYGASVLADASFGAIACGLFERHEFAAFCATETLELTVMFRYFSRSLERLMPFEWESRSGRSETSASRWPLAQTAELRLPADLAIRPAGGSAVDFAALG